MSKKYKCVIFDWDGTLMNSEARIVDSIQACAKAVGYPVLSYDESKEIIGLSIDKAVEFLYPQVDKGTMARMAVAYTKHFLEDSSVHMQPYPNVVELLAAIKATGAKIAIATGKSRKGLDQVLSEVKFADYFDMTRTPVESESKPSPLMLKQILEKFELSADEAIMVGDTSFDMEMAQNINMDKAALSHGVHELARLQKYNPVVCCDNLTELKNWLNNHLEA